jgi:hypothetical protein
MSTSDFAYWFDVPYPTAWAWLHGKRAGGNRGSYGQRFESLVPLLTKLEELIRTEGRLPIPFDLNRKNAKRAAYIRRLARHDNPAEFFAAYSSRKGVVLRNSA